MKRFELSEKLISAMPVAAATEGRDIYADGLKRVFDLFLAILCLPVVAPMILMIAVLVSRDGGPAFFGHERVGRDGRRFRCWKIRTMVPDAERRLAELLASDPEVAEKWRRFRKLDDDPRVTPLGALLRRTSLDELPQILNVILGDMSFVGPRPVTEAEMIHYGRHRASYCALRPGITGLWQVIGRNVATYEERVAFDVDYRRRIGFRLDLKILARTALVILRPTGQ